TDFAALLFAAIVAATVGHAAEAGQRSNRTVDNAHHFAKGDRVSTLEKHITTRLAAPAHHDAMVLQVEKDLLQELLWNALLLGDFGDELRVVISMRAGQRDQGPQRVFCLL